MAKMTAIATDDESDEEFQWDLFLAELVDYVRLELEGHNADVLYPGSAFHIQTSLECQEAYQRELQRQSLRQLDRAAMQHVVSLLPALVIAPKADWLEQRIEHGRAWLDGASKLWRQVQVSFADLTLGALGQPAVAGLMSDDLTLAQPAKGIMQVAPQGASFELTVAVSPDPAATEPAVYQAEVMLTLFERFGDYSGVELYLLWEDLAQQATTDAFGRARFTGLPSGQITAMSLIVVLPQDNPS